MNDIGAIEINLERWERDKLKPDFKIYLIFLCNTNIFLLRYLPVSAIIHHQVIVRLTNPMSAHNK